jgi:hypothetical protein
MRPFVAIGEAKSPSGPEDLAWDPRKYFITALLEDGRTVEVGP